MSDCKNCIHFPVYMWNGQKQDDCGFFSEARPAGHWIEQDGYDGGPRMNGKNRLQLMYPVAMSKAIQALRERAKLGGDHETGT